MTMVFGSWAKFQLRLVALAACLILLQLNRVCAENPRELPTVRIGAISNLTGEGSSWGINHQRGTILAMEQRNSAGGIRGQKVEILFEDSPGGVARNAVSAYRKLVDLEKVRVILGPLMGDELLAVSPLSLRDKVFMVGATYMPRLPDNFFSTWIDVDQESDLLAERLRASYGRIAILGSQQSWESAVAHRVRATFTKLGGEVVGFEEPSSDASDVAAEVLRISRGSPEAIVISSYFLLPHYAREIHRLGLAAQLFGIELDQSVIDSCEGRVEGLRFIGPTPPTKAFVDAFQVRWGSPPDLPAAHSYDAARVLFAALEQTDQSFEQLKGYFSRLLKYEGVTGTISSATNSTPLRTSWYSVVAGRVQQEQRP